MDAIILVVDFKEVHGSLLQKPIKSAFIPHANTLLLVRIFTRDIVVIWGKRITLRMKAGEGAVLFMKR